MFNRKLAVAAVFTILAACETSQTADAPRLNFVAPTSVSEATVWLQSEGFDLVRIERSSAEVLTIVSRSSTHRRVTDFDAVTYEILDDMMEPLQVASKDKNRGSGGSSREPQAVASIGSTATGSGNSVATTSGSNGPTGAANTSGSAFSEDSKTTSESETSVVRSTTEKTMDRNDGFTETRTTTTTTSSGSSTSSIGN